MCFLHENIVSSSTIVRSLVTKNHVLDYFGSHVDHILGV